MIKRDYAILLFVFCFGAGVTILLQYLNVNNTIILSGAVALTVLATWLLKK